jgi:hypothetical protein
VGAAEVAHMAGMIPRIPPPSSGQDFYGWHCRLLGQSQIPQCGVGHTIADAVYRKG